MNRLLSLIAIAVAACTMSACASIQGEGEILTETTKVSTSTDEISVSNAIVLTLSESVKPGTIAVTAHENIQKYIQITDRRGEVTIELTQKNIKNPYIIVAASLEQFNCIEASDASKVTLDGETPFRYYDIELSGAATFSGEFDSARNIELDLSGSSVAKISGSANECEADLAGKSSIIGNSFNCRTLDVDLEGESKIIMKVSKEIEGELSGSSSIRYKGNPKVSVETAGSSSVKAI